MLQSANAVGIQTDVQKLEQHTYQPLSYFVFAEVSSFLTKIADFSVNRYSGFPLSKLSVFNIFSHGFIPMITRHTRVISETVTLIDNILKNFIFDTSAKTGIIRSDLSDHLPKFVSLMSSTKLQKENLKNAIQERVMNKTNIENFKLELIDVNWNIMNSCRGTNSKYETSLKTFLELYKKHFLLNNFFI